MVDPTGLVELPSTAAMCRHYYVGGGETYDLSAESGSGFDLLGPVADALADFKGDLEDHPEKVGCNGKKQRVVHKVKVKTYPIDLTGEVFALGHGSIKLSAITKYVITCVECCGKLVLDRSIMTGYWRLDYSDEFVDPVDIFDWIPGNQELGGTPFAIEYHWIKRILNYREYTHECRKEGKRSEEGSVCVSGTITSASGA